MKKIIGKFAQYFLDPKYIAFAVTTQTCDMARRGHRCHAPYIAFSPIRLLSEVLPGLLDTTCKKLADSIYAEESKYKAKQLCERILNQNEEGLGLFYLHPDAEIELGEAAVVTLRVGFVLRSEHYELVRSSRIGRLGPEYQSRLGWLVGNIYSRVAVAGWDDRPDGKKTKEHMIRDYLSDPNPDRGPLWVQEARFRAALEAGMELDSMTRTEILEALAAQQPGSVGQESMNRIETIIREVFNESIVQGSAEKVVGRIRNDAALRQLLGQVDKCRESPT